MSKSRIKFVESNVPSELQVRVHHYHGGNTKDLDNSSLLVTHAWLVTKNGRTVSDAIAVCTAPKQAKRTVRRQIAIGRALKKYFQGEKQHAKGE